jgi:hypothetical protein
MDIKVSPQLGDYVLITQKQGFGYTFIDRIGLHVFSTAIMKRAGYKFYFGRHVNENETLTLIGSVLS